MVKEMLWCCASLQHTRSKLDVNQLGEQKNEVVVEKLAIKSIPLLPRQRLSCSPERSNLKCQISKHSLTASQSTQTLLSMQHPLSSFIKLETIEETNHIATEYTPSQQGIELKKCAVLFNNDSPQNQMSKDISNLYQHRNITSSDSDTLIYKPISDTSSESSSHISETIPHKTSDLIYNEPKFVNKYVSDKFSPTKLTSTNNTGPDNEDTASNFFSSSERLICVEDLEYHASTAEDKNLTENMKVTCETVTSELSDKNDQSQHSELVGKHNSHGFLITLENQNEYSIYTDVANVTEEPVAFSASTEIIHENQNEYSSISTDAANVTEEPVAFSDSAEIIHENQNEYSISTDAANVTEEPVAFSDSAEPDIQVPFSLSKRNSPKSASNIAVQETNSLVSVKQDSESKDSKSSVTTLPSPSLTSEADQTVPAQIFQQSIPSDTGLNDNKTFKLDVSQSIEISQPETEAIMPHSVNDVVPAKSKENEKHSDKHSKSTEELKADIKKENEETTISLNVEDLTLTKSNEHEKYSNVSTKTIVDSLSLVNDRHPTYIHSTCFNNTPVTKKHLQLQRQEPMPTFIAFNRQESKLNTKIFTPEHLSLFLATMIKNGCSFPESKFVQDTSCKTAKFRIFSAKSKSLQTKQTVSKQCALKNELKAHQQAEQNTSNKKKSENHSQYSPDISTYSDRSSKSETHKVKRKYFVKNTLRDSCPKEPTVPSKCGEKLSLRKPALESCPKHGKYATSKKDSVKMFGSNSLSRNSGEQSASTYDSALKKGNINTDSLEKRYTKAEILNEYNPMHFGNQEINKRNILQAANRYEIPTQQCSYNTKEVGKTNQKTTFVCPYNSNSSNMLEHKKLPTKCDKIPMKQQQFTISKLCIQTENLEDTKNVKKSTGCKETKKLGYSDIKQYDNNTHSNCIPKSHTYIADVLPLSETFSYDEHLHHGRSHAPISNPSKSSLLTIEERQEPKMCWTIIIKHVDPDELLE